MKLTIDPRNILTEFWIKLAKNFSWLFIGSGAKLLLGVFLMLYLGRMLGPTGFGQISFALALLSYFILFTDFGLQPLGTREIAAGSPDREQIISQVFILRLTLAGLSLVLILLLASLLTPSPTTRSLFRIFGLALIPMAANLAWFFKGREKMMPVGLSEILQISTYVLLSILFVKGVETMSFIPFFFLGSHILATGFLLILFLSRFQLPRPSLQIRQSLSLAGVAFPIALTMFLHQIYFNFDTLMLGFLRSEAEVGLYNAAYRVIMALIALNTVFMESMFPVFSRFFKKNSLETRRLLQKTLTISLIFSIPLTIGGTLLGRSLMIFLFGSEYAESGIALKILIWSAALAFLGANYGYCLVACQLQRYLAMTAALGTGINIILNFLLIPSHGILGACLATVVSSIVLLISQGAVFGWKVGFTLPHPGISLKAAGAGLMMILCLLLFKPGADVFLKGIIGTLVYSATLTAFAWGSLKQRLSLNP